jgi:hypothetical protein
MKSFSYRTFLIILIAFASLAASFPVHAQIPVTDGGAITALGGINALIGASNTALTAIQGSTAGSTSILTANKTQATTEKAIELAAYNLAQQLSRKLVALAINEINGGASGLDHPQQFITSYAQLFINTGNQATSLYLNSLAGNSKNPFAPKITTNLANNYASNQTALNQFSLNNYSGGNWQLASNNLAYAGINGWDYYAQSSLPQNNPVGSQMIAQQELAKSVQNAQSVQKTQISTSGYKPAQTPCNINYNANANDATITADQAQLTAAQQALDAIENPSDPNATVSLAAVRDASNNVTLAQTALQNAQNAQTSANTQFGTTCAKQIITNPVGAVDNLAAQAINKPFADLEKQSKWYTLISSALIQFAQGMINSGINHLQLQLQNTASLNSNSLNH